MLSRRVGSFRPLARAGATASIALIGMLLSATAALAATVGSATGTVTSTSAGFDTVQMSTTVPGAYAVPLGGGNITTWSTLAGPLAGPVGLQVWRPTLTTGTYVLVGASPLVTLTPNTLNTFTLAAPILVREGDLLGLRIEGRATYGSYTSSPADVYGSFQAANPNPAGGAIDAFAANTSFLLDVAATVEAVIPPPPPPTSGCDSTGDSTGNDVCEQ
jgi:hypothetical protein